MTWGEIEFRALIYKYGRKGSVPQEFGGFAEPRGYKIAHSLCFRIKLSLRSGEVCKIQTGKTKERTTFRRSVVAWL